MEFSHISPRGYSCHVIFTGSHYYFYSDFAGLFAIAERDYKKSRETGKETFSLKYGNDHLLGGSLGGSVAATVAKTFIRKAENKYIQKECTFIEEKTNLQNYALTVCAVDRSTK